MFKNKIVRSVIGVVESAVWEGQKNKGLELAPTAMLEAGLFDLLQKQGYMVYNQGRVFNDLTELSFNKDLKEPDFEQGALVGHLNKKIYEHSKSIAEKSDFMLNLGGDHSVAVGSIAGLQDYYGDDLKVIWIDAHPDCIQPDFSSYPYFHGMPLSQLFGWISNQQQGFDWLKQKLKPSNVLYLAIRDIDKDEALMIKSFGIKSYTMHEINELGVGKVCQEVVEWTKESPVHVSFDIDAIDPSFAPATGTLSRGGLTDREALFILQKLYLSQRMIGMDMVEINPLLDDKIIEDQLQNQPPGKRQAKQGVSLGVELIQAAFGRGLLQ